MKIIRFTALLILFLMLPSCGFFEKKDFPVITTNEKTGSSPIEESEKPAFSKESPSGSPSVEPHPSVEPSPSKTRSEELLLQMSLEEKIASLFIVRPETLDFSGNDTSETEMTEALLSGLSRYPVSGVMLSSYNIKDEKQLEAYIEALQSGSALPLFIAVDEEGGRVARIANSGRFPVKKYPSMLEVGKSGNPADAFEVGETIGNYLKKYGFNLDFAPVADVYTNKENKVIGDRSFGSDAELVAEMVVNAMKGFQKEGIIPTLKHFPGHGDTKGDTHKGFVALDKTWEELLQCELLPFISGIENGADMVMLAHITLKNVTGTTLPCTLSPEIIQNKLREELHFEGVVISDAMEMGAITEEFSKEEATLRFIMAGGDLILAPKDFLTSYNALLSAVREGKISESRIDESVLRILNLKEKYRII